MSLLLVPTYAVYSANLQTNKRLIQGTWYCPPQSAHNVYNRWDFNTNGTLVWLGYSPISNHQYHWTIYETIPRYSFITPTKISIGCNDGILIEKLTKHELRFKEISLGKVYPYECNRTPPPGDTSASRATSEEVINNQKKPFLGKWETTDRKNYVEFFPGNTCIKGSYEEGHWKTARRKFEIYYKGKSAMCGNNGMFSHEGPNKIVLDNGMGGSPIVYHRVN